MSDDQPTRDLDDPDDEQTTVELRRGRGGFTAAARAGGGGSAEPGPGNLPADETQAMPDDLVPGPGGAAQGGHGYGLDDTQPINLDDRPAWRRHPPRPPAGHARQRASGWPRQPSAEWAREPGAWPQADPPAGWQQAATGWPQPQGAPAAPDWRPLPQTGREEHGRPAGQRGQRGRQHLLVWVFTLLVAFGLGTAAVLGPLATVLDLSPQASALLAVVGSLAAWVLLSALLRLAGILAFLVTPLLFAARSIPELARLDVDLPDVSAATTAAAMALGLSSWLAGHWFFYARKGWWRSRVARALLSAIPGVEAAHRHPE